jgi:hypothetical protein
MNSGPFLTFLEELTGIEGLIPDPHYLGGGLHQLVPGGLLKVHVDFNRHTRLKLDRRLNLLLYLNPDWEESYGGHLELWNRDMTRCDQRILPIANRCVIFSTTEYSFHGNPEPVSCPPERTRRSIALYYYTSGQGAAEADGHTTLFRGRPGEELAPEEPLVLTMRDRLSRAVERWAPPALLEGARKAKAELGDRQAGSPRSRRDLQ